MQKVTSKDGTVIAYERVGKGPAIILVDGALQYRAFDQGTVQLANLLKDHFTVIYYDRRGRGDSIDTQPYAVEREIEDIEALINIMGGYAFIFGISSGAALALEAAIKLGDKVKKLAMYEAPYNSDGDARKAWMEYRKQLTELLNTGNRGGALALFMMLTGMPSDQVPEMGKHPMWPMLEAVAHTLAYDAAILGEDASVPAQKAAGISVPALIMAGEASYPFMHITAKELAKAIPNGKYLILKGQTHEVAAEALNPVLIKFFTE